MMAQSKARRALDTVAAFSITDSTRASVYILLDVDNSRFSAEQKNRPLGNYTRLRLYGKGKAPSFRIQYGSSLRWYDGDVEIVYKKGKLEIINIVDIEKYVAGVVESEGGHQNEIEYLKAQAILARTFAIKNFNKYSDEGYNLTDDIRSQVYLSRCHKDHAALILAATQETEGEIVVDKNKQPIIAAFHANSGGETANSEDVWVEAVSYLRSKKDSYSLKQKASEWTKVIPKRDYLSFFRRFYPQQYADPEFISYVLTFRQDTRIGYMSFKEVRIKVKDLRSYFKLRSSFFTVIDKQDNILLLGRGYGHGLGLSQEGAMKMAEQGSSHQEIIAFYFENTQIRNLLEVDLEY